MVEPNRAAPMTGEILQRCSLTLAKHGQRRILQETTIAENAEKRSEMKNINIWTEMPNYDENKVLLSVKTFEQLSGPWKEVTA
jgi:hypothetical protein